MIGIYCIQNKSNGKIYIGQSNNIQARWKSEKRGGVNRFLKEDFKNYGINCFFFYVLEECDVSQLNDRESFYIRLYHSYDREFGYNISLGGCFNKNRARSDWERKTLKNATQKRYREKHKIQITEKRKENKENLKKYFKEYNKKRKNSSSYKEYCKKALKNLSELRKKCVLIL